MVEGDPQAGALARIFEEHQRKRGVVARGEPARSGPDPPESDALEPAAMLQPPQQRGSYGFAARRRRAQLRMVFIIESLCGTW
jgi:hypothetical protein